MRDFRTWNGTVRAKYLARPGAQADLSRQHLVGRPSSLSSWLHENDDRSDGILPLDSQGRSESRFLQSEAGSRLAGDDVKALSVSKQHKITVLALLVTLLEAKAAMFSTAVALCLWADAPRGSPCFPSQV